MIFKIEFTDLGKKGSVDAILKRLNISDDDREPEVPVIRYIVQFPIERIVLYKIIKSKEWLPFPLSPNVPDDIIQRSIIEIEKFEKEKKPSY